MKQSIYSPALFRLIICALCLPLFPAFLFAGEGPCTYSTYKWNVNSREAVDFKRVSHAYMDLTEEEIDPETGCTVCEEDQVIIDIPPVKPFRVCKKLAPAITEALYGMMESGEPVFKVVGYRVGKTRGEPDSNGNRTGFSNHSFGVAIDINPDQNGLYDKCIDFGEHCRLIKGGPWLPGRPGTLMPESEAVRLMKRAGFKWGGEIAGRQKDFMHFSISGY
ncbi:MAG: M15 family metallopeptidase [Deltaproteobacteria bacterium]|nr:M15 family metallopeptidase [Deltaproteobacteria bacterium]